LPLGKFKSDTYTWTAQTTFSGKRYTKRGNFVVEEIQIEKLDTKANHGLLTAISNESSGKFYSMKDYQKLIKEISNREDITSISYEQSSYLSLLDYFWILMLLILIASIEWFLKRWYGYY